MMRYSCRYCCCYFNVINVKYEIDVINFTIETIAYVLHSDAARDYTKTWGGDSSAFGTEN
jgi:hypothetical protein